MKKRSTNVQGFTLIELVVGVSIMALIIGFSVVGFQNYARFQQYNQAVSDVAFILDQTRLNARSSVGDAAHGVHFTTNSITQFTGDTYVMGDPDNIVTNYSLVTLDHTFTGNVDDIVFEKLSGLPSATGTVVVAGIDFSASTTISVSNTGVVQ